MFILGLCPVFFGIVVSNVKLRSYRDVANLDAGLSFYQEDAGLAEFLEDNCLLSSEDVALVKTLMYLGGVQVIGINTLKNLQAGGVPV